MFQLLTTFRNTFPPVIAVGNTFPLVITVGNAFPLVITVGNTFLLVMTVENTFPLLITVAKNNGSSFFPKDVAHMKCHLWVTVMMPFHRVISSFEKNIALLITKEVFS